MEEPHETEALQGRISGVEKDIERHEGVIGELQSKVQALEICASCLPDIKIWMLEIKHDLDVLKTNAASNAGQEKGKKNASLWHNYGSFLGPLIAGGVLVLVGFGLATYLHVSGA